MQFGIVVSFIMLNYVSPIVREFRKAASGLVQRSGTSLTKHYNTIQFYGYISANALWMGNEIRRGDTFYGLNLETFAGATFFLGPWLISQQKNVAYAKFLGGVVLTAGTGSLALAGYPLTGLPSALASMEVTRGGLRELRAAIDMQEQSGVIPSAASKIARNWGNVVLSPYENFVEKLCSASDRAKTLIYDRPFLTSSCLRVSARAAFIGKKALEGDIGGAVAGAMCLTLGDIPMSLNDTKIREWVKRKTGLKSKPCLMS